MKKRDVSLTTAAHRPAFDLFVDAMQAAASREGWRSSEVVRHFLDAGFLAVRGRTLPGDAFEKNEGEYMALVRGCSKPGETMSDLSRMLAAVFLAMQAEPVDFIGPVFSEVLSSDEMGQFFTPFHLSRMMAMMVLSDAKAMLQDRPFIMLAEPACGVGGMVLAANTVLRDQGIDVARQAHWYMVDVDRRAFCGAYLQAAFSDTSATVIHGNSLSLEVRTSALTPAAIFYPKDYERKPATATAARLDLPAEAVSLPSAQLQLF